MAFPDGLNVNLSIGKCVVKKEERRFFARLNYLLTQDKCHLSYCTWKQRSILRLLPDTNTYLIFTINPSISLIIRTMLTQLFPSSIAMNMNCLLNACTYLDDRKTYSRERNKMHARKTRQRKKEQMKTLETQVDELKARQVEIKRDIEEKVTANILVELYTKCKDDVDASIDPKVEKLLKRPTEEIPDSSQVPELPALILPGQHSNRRGKGSTTMDYPDDGIDYKLLAKDRSTCSQEELDKIRRERNRMHAKRTRDRKRIFVEEMEKIIKQLSTENMLLEEYLISISDMSRSQTPTLGRSPSLGSQTPVGTPVPTIHMLGKACESDIAELFANRGTKRSLEVSSPAPCASDVSTSTLSCNNSSGQSIESSHEDTYVGKRVCVSSDKESHSYSSQAPRS